MGRFTLISHVATSQPVQLVVLLVLSPFLATASSTPTKAPEMFGRLEVILGYFPACREVQALLIAMQLCAHCLALTVLAATVGSYDPAPHFRTRMSAALQRDSIYCWYARPRDFYAALFALDISLDDEAFTAVGCSVALTQGFLLRPSNCRFGLPPRFGHFPSYVIASTSCMVGLTWIMLAPKGLGMQARMLGLDVASCWRRDMSWCRPCLGLIFLG